MLTHHPDVYLYGALVEAEPYLMNDKRITSMGKVFMKEPKKICNRLLMKEIDTQAQHL